MSPTFGFTWRCRMCGEVFQQNFGSQDTVQWALLDLMRKPTATTSIGDMITHFEMHIHKDSTIGLADLIGTGPQT
jgi:hypothetical protein